MNDPLKVKDGSQPWKIGIMVLALLLASWWGWEVLWYLADIVKKLPSP